MRPIRREPAVHRPASFVEHDQRVVIELSEVGSHPAVRIRLRQPRVVPEQPAPDVAQAEAPPICDRPAHGDLDRVVVPYRFRQRQPARRRRVGKKACRAPEPGIAHRVDFVGVGVASPDVLDRAVHLLVHLPRRQQEMATHLVLDAGHGFLQPHGIQTRIDRRRVVVQLCSRADECARTRGRTRGTSEQRRPVGGIEREGVGDGVEATERRGQRVPEDVVEDAPAAVDLPKPVAPEI